MIRYFIRPFCLLPLGLSFVAASSAPAIPAPAFILQWGTNGTSDGQFLYPWGVAIDAAGNVYVSDSKNDRMQKLDRNGTFLTQWGTTGAGEGHFYKPIGVALDASGKIYVAEFQGHRIQKFGGPWLDYLITEPDLPLGH